MNKYKVVFVALFGFIISASYSLSQSKQRENPPDSERLFLLAAYGKAVFEREGCRSCHSLVVDEAGFFTKSLDGLGNKYPNVWLAHYLTDPESIMSGSKKKSYGYLFDKTFDKALFTRIVSENNNERLWPALLDEASSFTAGLDEGMLLAYNKHSDGIALIAFLQQIPTSPKQRQIDSMIMVELERENAIVRQYYLDSIQLSAIINQPEAISKGEKIYLSFCHVCHGDNGAGNMIGPNLTDEYWLHGGKDKDVAKTIIEGIAEKGMPGWIEILKPQEIGALVAYIKSIKGTHSPHAKSPQGIREN